MQITALGPVPPLEPVLALGLQTGQSPGPGLGLTVIHAGIHADRQTTVSAGMALTCMMSLAYAGVRVLEDRYHGPDLSPAVHGHGNDVGSQQAAEINP